MMAASDIRCQVTIEGVVLRVYICADSLGAVTAFVDDFGSVFKPETEDMCVLHLSNLPGD
jgi:autophagy-related protein 2